ncbi:MAG: 23S rRNA (uracil(1939)-C(5))-methyltransferase RlmD [Eubacterium sp.]|nr:23S rRNA (uracil(1939)-C(5))-methyltransferase RlmD [Eubacterium sp.]
MKKNDKIELTIEDLSADGAGVGKVGGMTFFVKDALIGDTVRAKIMKLKKTYGYARLEEICRPSPYRIQPKCPLHRQCGGCQIQALSYEKQLEYKQNKIKNNLQRIGGFAPEEIPMEPIIGMAHPFSYRNKAQFPVGRDKNGKLAAGFYAAHTHDMIPVENCCLGVPVNQAVMDRVLAWMEQTGTEPYDEKTGRGLIRHVLVRYGFRTEQLMVCLVINGKSLPNAEKLADSLQEIRGMASLSVSINKERNNVIMGNHIQTLWGKDAIEDLIGNIRFQISPLSFYQVNPVQTEVLYQKVMEYAGLTGNEIVWDLYCGIGTISLFLAQKAKKVYGIEIIPQAVADARRNAERNGIGNAVFLNGDAQDVLEQLRREEKIETGEIDGNATKEAREDGLLQPQVVVVDPPRKGCGEKLLETIVEVRAKRVVYVSCDSATLARDLRYLCERGYVMERVQGVDQFCQTVHVETVCLLSKLHSDQHIEVELHMDELDLTAAESKATYEEIKDYVLEHSGLKVSSLYIAQVKEKCGIIERVNYNLPKSENSRQPKCPPEKEAAIREALEYFRMI